MKLRSLLRPLACLALATTLASCGGGGGGGDNTEASLNLPFTGLIPKGYTQAKIELQGTGAKLTLVINVPKGASPYAGTGGKASGNFTYNIGTDTVYLDYDSEVLNWEHGTDNKGNMFYLSTVQCGEDANYHMILMEELQVAVTLWDADNGVMEGIVSDGGILLKDKDVVEPLAKYELDGARTTLTYSKSAGE